MKYRTEVLLAPEFPGRSPARKFVAEIRCAGQHALGWGPTRTAAARAARLAFRVSLPAVRARRAADEGRARLANPTAPRHLRGRNAHKRPV
jgi:hypothetical protein